MSDRKKVIVGISGAAVTAGSFAGLGGEVVRAQEPPVEPVDGDFSEPAVDSELTTPAPVQPAIPEIPSDLAEHYSLVQPVSATGQTLSSLQARYGVPEDVLQRLNPDPTASTFFVPLAKENTLRNHRLTEEEATQQNEESARRIGLVATSDQQTLEYAGEIPNDTDASVGHEEDEEWWREGYENILDLVAGVVGEVSEFIGDRQGNEQAIQEDTPRTTGGSPPQVMLKGLNGQDSDVSVSIDSGSNVVVTFNGTEVNSNTTQQTNTPNHVQTTSVLNTPNTSTQPAATSEVSEHSSSEAQTQYSTYQEVLDSIPDFEEHPAVAAVQGISVYTPTGLKERSVAFDEKVEWLRETSRDFLTPEAYLAFEKDGIDTTLAEKDVFAGERSSRKLSGTCVTLHWMAGKAPSTEAAAQIMKNRDQVASANFFLMRDGSLSRAMPDEYDVAYHAGPERNYDCWGIEIEGQDVNDFTTKSHVSVVNWVVQRHRALGMKLERNVVAVEGLGLHSYNDFDSSSAQDRSIFGTVNAHGEIKNNGGKIDPTSRYVNLVFQDAVELNAKIDAYLAQQSGAGNVVQTAFSGAENSERTNPAELKVNGGYELEVVSPLGRDFKVNDSHMMFRNSGYANGQIQNPYYHWGWDVEAAAGENVYAPITGKIHIFNEVNGRNAGMGNVAIIEAENGEVIQLGHLGAFVYGLEHGQLITAGQHIASVGSSGVATGNLLDIKAARFTTTAIQPFSGPSSGAEPLNPALFFSDAMYDHNYSSSAGRGIVGLAEGEVRRSMKLLEEYRGLLSNSGDDPEVISAGYTPTVTVIDGNGYSQNLINVSRPTIVSLDEYRLMKEAAEKLTGNPNNAMSMYANRPRVISFAPQVNTAPSVIPNTNYNTSVPPEVATVSETIEMNIVEDIEKLKPVLSNALLSYQPLSPAEAEARSRNRVYGEAIEPSDVYILMRAQGATINEALTFTALAGRESGWRPAAVGDMSTSHSSYGLTQIRDFDEGVPQRDANYNLNPIYSINHSWDMYQEHGTGDKGFKPWRTTVARHATVDAIFQAIRLPNDSMSPSQRSAVDENMMHIATRVMNDFQRMESMYQQVVGGGLMTA